jgi:hypothetical protein
MWNKQYVWIEQYVELSSRMSINTCMRCVDSLTGDPACHDSLHETTPKSAGSRPPDLGVVVYSARLVAAHLHMELLPLGLLLKPEMHILLAGQIGQLPLELQVALVPLVVQRSVL